MKIKTNINPTITFHHLQTLNLPNFIIISSSMLSSHHLIFFLSHFNQYHCHIPIKIYSTITHSMKILVSFIQKLLEVVSKSLHIFLI